MKYSKYNNNITHFNHHITKTIIPFSYNTVVIKPFEKIYIKINTTAISLELNTTCNIFIKHTKNGDKYILTLNKNIYSCKNDFNGFIIIDGNCFVQTN